MISAPRMVPALQEPRTTDIYKLLGVAPASLILTEREVRLEVRPVIRGWRARLGRSPRLWAEHVELNVRPNPHSAIGAVVQVDVPASALIVTSTDIKLKERRKIEHRVRRDVLVAERFSGIHIDVRDLVTDARADHVNVRARLRIRGIDQDVRFVLRRRSSGLYESDFTISLKTFGIPPIGSFLGGMWVEDELSIHLKLNTRAVNGLAAGRRDVMAALPGITMPEHQPDTPRAANDD